MCQSKLKAICITDRCQTDICDQVAGGACCSGQPNIRYLVGHLLDLHSGRGCYGGTEANGNPIAAVEIVTLL